MTYREVWQDYPLPGGFVCAECGMPVESEPCPDHCTDPDEPREVVRP